MLRQVDAAWPAGVVKPLLVADRIFPSHALFSTLLALAWRWCVRLRVPQTVTVAGTAQRVRALLPGLEPAQWTLLAGAFGQGRRAIAGTLVLGQGLPVLRWHQRDAGSARARQRRRGKRAADAGYARADRPSAAAQTDAWLVLFTSEPTVRAALVAYRQRWAVESSYRGAQSGWARCCRSGSAARPGLPTAAAPPAGCRGAGRRLGG